MKKTFCVLMVALLITVFSCVSNAQENTMETPFVEFYPQYSEISEFSAGVALVATNSGTALIDRYNSVLFTTDGEIIGYANGNLQIKSDAGIAFYDKKYSLISSFDNMDIIYAKGIINGKIPVQTQNSKFGLISVDGNLLLEYIYDDVVCSIEHESMALCRKDSNWYLIDVSSCSETIGISNYIEHTGSLIINQDNLGYGAIDYTGRVIIPYKYSDMKCGEEYIFAFTDTSIDWYTKNGEWVCSTVRAAENLSEGLFYDSNTGTYQNAVGEEIIQKEKLTGIEEAQSFHENLAVVIYDDRYSYITKNGDIATSKTWSGAYPFAHGYALVYNNVYDVELQVYFKQWCIINRNFEIVKKLDFDVYIDSEYSASTDFSDGYIRTIDNETGLMGFIYLESYRASSNNQLKLSPTSLYQIDRESQTLSEVFKDTTVKDFKNHFHNDTEMLRVIDAGGNTLNDDAYVVDGCKVQLISKSDGTTILDELTIKLSEKIAETDPPTTDPDNPIDPNNPGTDPNKPDNDSDVTNFIDSIADKVGVTSDQLLMIAGGSLAALVLLIIVIVAIKRKRR